MNGVPYITATTVRVTRPWKSSRSRAHTQARRASTFDRTIAVEREYTREDHKRRIAEILASSKWNHDYTQQ